MTNDEAKRVLDDMRRECRSALKEYRREVEVQTAALASEIIKQSGQKPNA